MSDALSGQSAALPHLDEPSDAELISAVRAGDVEAYGVLFGRHVDAARRLARQLVSAGDVDDLVSEAFAKVLGVLQRGGGPDLAFRAYLLTSVRRLHVDKLRAGARLQTTDDMTPFDPGVPFEDTAVSGFDNATAAKAFAQLPERWQQVLWHTEVEGQKPADIAPLLGMSANSVSALAYRAREGLRQAFISMHAQDAADDLCATTRANLGAYIRNGISKRDAAKVEAHLGDCRECTAIYLELTEVNHNIGALIAPIVLGSAAAAYLGTAAAVGAKAGIVLFFDRAKDWLLTNPAGRAVAGAGGIVAVAAAVAIGVQAAGGDEKPVAPAAQSQPSEAAPPAADAPAAPPAGEEPPADEPAEDPAEEPPVVADPIVADEVAEPAETPGPTEGPTEEPAEQSDPVISTPLPEVTATPGGSVVIDLTRGATDPDGDPLSVAKATVAAPAHGTVRIGGAAARPVLARTLIPLAARGGRDTVVYTPQTGWRGTDTIDYVLTDGEGGRVAGSVEVRTPNAGPTAVADTRTLTAGQTVDIAVLANDSDVNGDTLTISAADASGSGGGTVARAGTVLRYAPKAGFTGTETFSYTVSDGHGGRATATVTVTVDPATPDPQPEPANRPPTAGDVRAEVEAGASVTVTLPADDPDGDRLTVELGSPAGGTAAYDPQAGTLRYTADEDYEGTDTFRYTVSDGRATASGTVTVVVTAPEEPEPSGDLAISADALRSNGNGVGNSDQLRLDVSGIPDGGTARVVLTIEGFLSFRDNGDNGDCTPSIDDANDRLTLSCEVAADGSVVDYRFDGTRDWTFTASVTAVGFTDTGGDNEVAGP